MLTTISVRMNRTLLAVRYIEELFFCPNSSVVTELYVALAQKWLVEALVQSSSSNFWVDE